MEYVIAKDEKNRSLMKYGTLSFPVAFFQDDVRQYRGGMIDWHWHEEMEFVLVLKNHVLCSAGEEHRTLSAGEGMFINRNIIHRFGTRDEGQMISLVFSPRFIASPVSNLYASYVEPILQSSLYTCVLTPEIAWQAKVLGELGALAELFSRGENNLRELDVYILFLQIWRDFFADSISQEKTVNTGFVRGQERLRQMLAFIENNYAREITAEDIAAAANISSSEARRCFRKLMDKSPGKYLNEYRLTCAGKLLCSTDMPIACVADAVGFQSASYFDRMFVRQFGMTPQEMRKNKTLGD